MDKNKKEIWNKIKKSRWFSFVISLVAIAACIGIGVGIAYYEDANDPVPTAAEYFRAFIASDFEGMYSKLYQKDAKIDKNLYIEKMRSLRQNYVIDSYDISEPKNKNGNECVVLTCKSDDKQKKEFVAYIKKEGFFNPDFYIDQSLVQEDEEMMAYEYENILTASADKIINQYYIDVREKDKKCKELCKLLASSAQAKKNAQKAAKKNIKFIFKGKKVRGKEFKSKDFIVTDFVTSKMKKSFKYNAANKQFTVAYSYNYKYKAETSVSLASSFTVKNKGKRKAVMTITYNYKDEKVTVAGFNLKDKKIK